MVITSNGPGHQPWPVPEACSLGGNIKVQEITNKAIIDITFIEKNLDNNNDKPHYNVSNIDALLAKKYNRAMLETIVGLKQ